MNDQIEKPINEADDKKEVLQLALYGGEVLLKNGAETYRTEETIEVICRSRGFNSVNAFVTPTGIFISEDRAEGISYLKRIRFRTIHLGKIARINDLSKAFVDSEMDPRDAIRQVRAIDQETPEHRMVHIVSGSLAAGFFAALFGGGPMEFALAVPVAALAIMVCDGINRLSHTSFLANAAGGTVIGFLGLLTGIGGLSANIDPIIVGAIMPLVPGVALVTGLRDFIEGDLISGTSRVSEAIIIAISIAVGVGAVFRLWAHWGGGY